MKIHLIDGTYELFRAHFGAPPARAADGREVGATRGLMRSMMALIREQNVSHIAAAFDTVVESFRNDLYAGYKTGDGIDPDLLAQFPLAERAIAAMGIQVWPMVEFEADDALASGAELFATEPEVEQVVICSPDKDLAQCVKDEVVCLDRMRERILDEEGVMEKFGVPPASIPDWLGLVGDQADGLPGIPRWGAKSSSTVLRRFGHIKDIPDDYRSWDIKVRGAASLAQNLSERRDEALLYCELATLRLDVPLNDDLDALRWRGANRPVLKAICDEIGMRGSFLERVPVR